MNSSKSTKDDGWWGNTAEYFNVACRLCGEVWKFPKSYMGAFKDDRLKWVCPNCRNKIRLSTVYGFFND